MRTTINIDDELLSEVKQIAAKRHVPVGAIVDNAIRDYLVEKEQELVDFTWADIAVDVPGGGGLRPGVNWRSNSAMLELIEEP